MLLEDKKQIKFGVVMKIFTTLFLLVNFDRIGGIMGKGPTKIWKN